MSRRKKHLGDENTTRAREMPRRSERAVELSNDQIRAGDCAGAFDNLVDAGILLGTAEGAIARPGPKIIEAELLVDIDADLSEAREAFQDRCLRRAPDSRPLTFRRGGRR